MIAIVRNFTVNFCVFFSFNKIVLLITIAGCAVAELDVSHRVVRAVFNTRYNPLTGRYERYYNDGQYNPFTRRFDGNYFSRYNPQTGQYEKTFYNPHTNHYDFTGRYNPQTGRYEKFFSGQYYPDTSFGRRHDSSFYGVGSVNAVHVPRIRYNNEGHWATLRDIRNSNSDSYHYSYETENGIRAAEDAHLENKHTPAETTKKTGFYEYIGDDGKNYRVDYVADENGFHAEVKFAISKAKSVVKWFV